MMLFHTTFVIRILAGNAVGWPPSRAAIAACPGRWRCGATSCMRCSASRPWSRSAVLTPSYLPWILPVVAGLILSAPVAVLTSRLKAGALARRYGMFVTPEERSRTRRGSVN